MTIKSIIQKTALAAFIFLLSIPVFCRDIVLTGSMAFGGMFMTGISDLKSDLKDAGYPSLLDNAVYSGGLISFGIGKFTLYSSVYSFEMDPRSNDNYDISLYGYHSTIEFSYDIFEYKGLAVYPKAGIGFGKLNLQICRNESASFDDIITNPDRGTQLRTGSFLVQGGIGVEYFYKMFDRSGPVAGAEATYVQDVFPHDWIEFMDGRMGTGDTEVKGGPDASVSGFQYYLTLGWRVLL